MNFKILKPDITRQEFLETLIQQFPNVKDEVLDEDYKDLIHLQVAVLARYANDQIKSKRLDEAKRIFNFFEKVIDKVDSKTENALYVSFLEHVEFVNLS